MTVRSIAASCLAALALGCAADETTGVIVHVDAQRWGKANAASMRVTVWSEDGARAFQQDWALAGESAMPLPIVVWVRSSSDGGPRFLIEAVLHDAAGDAIHTAWGTATLEPGALRRALLCVADGCRFARCGTTAACMADPDACERCDVGACAPPELEFFSSESRPSCPGISEAGTETVCWDGSDDDTDGTTDCEDRDCDAKTCDTLGRSCVDEACECPLSGPETDCGNGLNDDCEGGVDCADSDCDGQTCGEHGQACSGGACVCPLGEIVETTCGDGADNDCDGAVDCADLDCADRACGPSGLVCLGASCICGTGLSTETACADGIDDDCNGATDCADAACSGQACGPNGLACVGGTCACTRGSVQTCGALAPDEDCDGLAGCADLECSGAFCWFNGEICSGGACVCPGGTVETVCDDRADNDCDASRDCDDNQCQHQRCDPASVCCGAGCRDYRLSSDCGGCNSACSPGNACREIRHSGRIGYVCGCGGGAGCPRGQTCRSFPDGMRCSCDDDGDCADDQFCVRRAGEPNFCQYRWM